MKLKMKLEWVVDLEDTPELPVAPLCEIEDNFMNDERTIEFCGQGNPVSDIKCTVVKLEDLQ